MPSSHLMSPMLTSSLGLMDGDNEDASFFNKLGEELDGSLPNSQQDVQNVAIFKKNSDLILQSLSSEPCLDVEENQLESTRIEADHSISEEMSISDTNAAGTDMVKSLDEPEGVRSDMVLSPAGTEGKAKPQTKVTEVQWSKFSHASESGQGGFGSYSDFFSQLSYNPTDQTWNTAAEFDGSNLRGSGSFMTDNDVQAKTTSFAGDSDLFKPQAVNSHLGQCASQNTMHNFQFSPRERSAYGQFEIPSSFHLVSQYRSMEPVGQQDYRSSSGVFNAINDRSTLVSHCQPSDVGGLLAGSSAVLTDNVGPLNRDEQQNQEVGRESESLSSLDSGWGLLQGQDNNSSQPLEMYSQHNQPWGQYAVTESGDGHLYYDPQYPGWCYDYQSQKWREIPGYVHPNSGYIQQGQEISSAGSVFFPIQQNFTIEQGSTSYETVPASNVYAPGNYQSEDVPGFVSQKAEKLTVERPQNGYYMELKQGAYFPASEEKFKDNIVNADNLNYSASAQQPCETRIFTQQNQAQLAESNSNEINLMSSTFSHLYGPSHASDSKLLAPIGDWNHGSKSNGDSSFNGGMNNSAYVSQYASYSQQAFYKPVTHSPPRTIEEALRSPVGKPPCSIVTFGFGGKVVILKPNDPLKLESIVGEQSFLNAQQCMPGPIQVCNLSQMVKHENSHSGEGFDNIAIAFLGSEGFSGPFAGGSMSHKDILKWIDEKVSVSETELAQSSSKESIRILWGSLKIAFQHYGKLRSSPGMLGIGLQGQNGPEAALANLLQPKYNEPVLDSLQSLPTEHQLQATAYEVKRLLIAGKQKEALICAQEGQLWGPALVLARELGDKPYADTVADMARHLFCAGSPLQVLNLLFAGQPSEIFAGKIMSPRSKPLTTTNPLGAPLGVSSKDGIDGLLGQWQENLATMAANRTNGDEQVIMHLGDCLWERQGEVAAAHTCYLIADANFECYSNNSRLCLIGADHYKYPRTFASPEAIQRTELYEYSKLMGNPQFVLAPFQPYKLVYASFLAEVGKVAEASRYCQAVLKTLKTAGRTPDVEACRQFAAALEDRLHTHGQAGNFSNLAPGKLMGRLLNSLDKSIHRMMGAPPPPTNLEVTSAMSLESSMKSVEAVTEPTSNIIKNNAPLMVPSASMEPICDLMSRDRSTGPARSVSAPDFSESPKKDGSERGSAARLSSSYFGRVGSQLVKAVGLMVKFNTKEAKLGDTNKFYYDEKLKRWVEEGAELPPEEPALPPPPTMSKQYPQSEISAGIGLKNNAETVSGAPSLSGTTGQMSSLGIPPVPPSGNHFSARSRHQGVRSRYVDTFNKTESVTPPRAVHSALLPPLKSGITPSKFFVPAPLPAAHLDSSFSDQVVKENSNDAAVILEKSYNHTEAHTILADSFTAAVKGDRGHIENASMANSKFSLMTTVAKPMKRTLSAEDSAFFRNASMGSHSVGGEKYIPNGVHSRAASWSDSPVSYGNSAESYTYQYAYQSPEVIENKQTMKQSLFSATEVTSSTVPYSYDVPSKPFSGTIPSTSLPPPPLLDITGVSSTNCGSAPDMSVDPCTSSTPEKQALDAIVTTEDLQEVEL